MRKESFGNGSKIGYSQTSAMLTELKKCEDFAFLKEVDSIALQQSLRDLDRGFEQRTANTISIAVSSPLW
jgi:putative transposase